METLDPLGTTLFATVCFLICRYGPKSPRKRAEEARAEMWRKLDAGASLDEALGRPLKKKKK